MELTGPYGRRLACTSSRVTEEAFTDVDGEAMITRLAATPAQRWRYISGELRLTITESASPGSGD